MSQTVWTMPNSEKQTTIGITINRDAPLVQWLEQIRDPKTGGKIPRSRSARSFLEERYHLHTVGWMLGDVLMESYLASAVHIVKHHQERFAELLATLIGEDKTLRDLILIGDNHYRGVLPTQPIVTDEMIERLKAMGPQDDFTHKKTSRKKSG